MPSTDKSKDAYGTFAGTPDEHLPLHMPCDEDDTFADDAPAFSGSSSSSMGGRRKRPFARLKSASTRLMAGGVLLLIGVMALTARHRSESVRNGARTVTGTASHRAKHSRRTSRLFSASEDASVDKSANHVAAPEEQSDVSTSKSAKDGASSTSESTDGSSSTLPNFLVIMADDVGMSDLGYLNSDIHSPVIDKLASEGVKIERFYTQSLCTPARGAFLTGKYPMHTGTQYDTVSVIGTWGLDLDVNTLADHLQDKGYATHLVGKWHLGHSKKDYLPISRGFDTYMGYLEAEVTYYSHQTTDSCNCDGPFYDFIKATPDKLQFVQDNSTRSDVLYSKRAVQIIEEHDASTPLYLQMTFQNAHRPLADVVEDDFTDEQLTYLHTIDHPARKRFTASVMKLDDAVDNIVTALEAKGLLDNTYIIFLSDNGGCYQAGGLNLPFRGTKSHLWEGGVRTPSFVAGPLVPETKQGTTYANMFHVTDWMPTILNLIGYSTDDIDDLSIDGVSHKQAMLGDSDTDYDAPRTQLLLNFENMTSYTNGGIIVGKWKLLLNEMNQSWYDVSDTDAYLTSDDEGSCTANDEGTGTRTDWLFDLIADPFETTNLYDDYPDVVFEMMKTMYSFIPSVVASYDTAGTQDIDAIAMFDKVGYVCPWLDDDKSYFSPPEYVYLLQDTPDTTS